MRCDAWPPFLDSGILSVVRKLSPWFIVMACSVPLTAFACEPIFPIVQLLGGSSVFGPLLISSSLMWLFVAVIIKCAAFVMLQHELLWPKAVLLMLVANVVSTIPGVLIAAFVGSISGIFLGIPLTFVLALMVGRRWKRMAKPGEKVRISGGLAGLGFTILFIGSIVLFEVAAGALAGRSYATYWILKFLFVALVACSGIVISGILEECVIARLARKSIGDVSFLTPVLRANYITLGVILLVGAVQMLLARLEAPNFIVGGLNIISSFLGLG